jgi:hypothetical protein
MEIAAPAQTDRPRPDGGHCAELFTLQATPYR